MNVDFTEKEMGLLLDGLYNLEMDLEFRIDEIREVLNDPKFRSGDNTYNYK
ncbi:MAG: hypothetical protein ACRC41_13005 [Sarcina sp.]